MNNQRRVRLTEREGMEGGVTCPGCGRYNSFGDVIAVGRCRGVMVDACETSLALELVVDPGADVDAV
jgi:hypothetical protein